MRRRGMPLEERQSDAAGLDFSGRNVPGFGGPGLDVVGRNIPGPDGAGPPSKPGTYGPMDRYVNAMLPPRQARLMMYQRIAPTDRGRSANGTRRMAKRGGYR
jgi:hypothetical protein